MDKKVIGNTAQVTFLSLGGRGVEGKVDTGATTSSLHAEDIQQGRGQVRFRCPMLSDNYLTLPLDGSQEVHSADAGGVTRPIVTLDVEVDGKLIRNASFNLNDRSGMDSHVLIGQNILQDAGFIIDPSRSEKEHSSADVTEAVTHLRDDKKVLEAVAVLVENGVTLSDLVTYLRTLAVNEIKD